MLEKFVRERVNTKGIAVMGHIVCGYPSFEANMEILEEMDKAGVDLVEMQFPFSEPIADGPLFLTANQASLDKGTKIADCFNIMKEASKRFSFKTLMMGYYNTVFKAGEVNFCERLKASGACGLIVPDLPLEEDAGLVQAAEVNNLSLIRLVAPTNTGERIQQILEHASGFVYAVARKGVTGSKTKFAEGMEEYFQTIKKYASVPVAVGFGISQRADLDYLKEQGRADIAVMGTAILKTYLESGREGLASFFKNIMG
ncbi:MAG: tryptophan synthase subunit alpha [Fibrobacteria bacterium]|nr:tryptophan synthase subunit alpha [Fibrobacteria bacterium]